MEMIVDFPHGARVDAHFGSLTIPTDQGPPVGEGTAPAPFGLFLASIGTCAGIYVLSFCRQRGIPTDNIRVIQKMDMNRMTGLLTKIDLEIQVPASFPEKYYKAVIRAADQCAVKKHFEDPPAFDVYTKVVDE